MTTYTAVISALAEMNVPGVRRRYAAPPLSLSTADLPASYPMLPSGSDANLVLGNGGLAGGNQPTITVDLVFALEPIGQGTYIQNFAAATALIDNIVTASRELARPTRGPLSFVLRLGIVTLAGTEYWAVVETWTGTG